MRSTTSFCCQPEAQVSSASSAVRLNESEGISSADDSGAGGSREAADDEDEDETEAVAEDHTSSPSGSVASVGLWS